MAPTEVWLRAGWGAATGRAEKEKSDAVRAKLRPFRVTVEQDGAQVASPRGRL